MRPNLGRVVPVYKPDLFENVGDGLLLNRIDGNRNALSFGDAADLCRDLENGLTLKFRLKPQAAHFDSISQIFTIMSHFMET